MKPVAIIFLLLVQHLGICQTSKKDSLLIKKYESLSTQIDSLHSELDLISKRSDSIYESVNARKVTPEEVRYDQILQDVSDFNKKYKDLINSASFPSTIPVVCKKLGSIVGYGEKYHPVIKTKLFHKGIDFPVEEGQVVTSTISGKVEFAGTKASFGKYIVIGSELGIKTYFAHLDSIFVKKGGEVIVGQEIGTVGNTGLSIVSHLHYEISINDEFIDPLFTFFDLLKEEDVENIFGSNNQSFD